MSAAARVLIVGGGIGGLSSAIALAAAASRSRSSSRTPSGTCTGSGIIQPGNAMRALHQLGARSTRRMEAGFAMDGDRFFLADGHTADRQRIPGWSAPNTPGSTASPDPGCMRS